MEQKERINYIDGIRGMAAVIVVFNHYLTSFFPALFIVKDTYSHTSSHIEEKVAFMPFNILYNGGFAVCLFFVISGYALSYSYIVTRNVRVLPSSAIRRYFRLAIPIVFSVIVSYVILMADGYSNVFTATQYTKNTFWFSHLWNMQPNVWAALKEGTYSCLFTGGNPEYNPVLWTMNVEFMGSLLVFAILALFGSIKNRFWIYVLLVIIVHVNYMPAFIIGLALCDYYHSQDRKQLKWYLTIILLIGSLYLGQYHNLTPNDRADLITNIYTNYKSYPYILAAVLFVLAAISSPLLQSVFSNRVFRFLGKISFSLYLLHLIILGSLSCSLFGFFYSGMHFDYWVSFILMFLIAFPITVVASYIMYKYVDLSGIKFSKWFYTRLFE